MNSKEPDLNPEMETKATLETSIVTVEGQQVRLARLGSGPALVCTHGYPETLFLYSELAKELREDFEIIVFDWPGLGGSDRWGESSTPADRAWQLHQIITSLDIDEAYALGTDMGGPAVLSAAAAYPSLLNGVIISNSLVVGTGPTSREIALFRKFPLLNRIALRHAPGLVFERCLRTFLPSDTSINKHVEEDFREKFRQRRVRDCLVEMCADYDSNLEEMINKYRTIEIPVLAVWGERDYHFPPTQGRMLASLVPNAQFEVVQGGHHWMVLTHPAVIGDQIRVWVDSFTSENSTH